MTHSTDLSDELRARLEQRLARARARAAPGQQLRAVSTEPVLSAAQLRLWFLQLADPGSAAYNVPLAWRLVGDLDATVLDASLRALLGRHQVLRTRYAGHYGQPQPVLEASTAFALREVTVATAADARRVVDDESARPFRLADELPVRATLARVDGSSEAALVVVVHHIAADGWSIALLREELSQLYGALRAGVPPRLRDPAPQHADLAGPTPGEDVGARRRYWRARLAGAPPLLALPTSRERPPRPSGRGAIHRFVVGDAVAAQVRDLARRLSVTPYSVLLAAFAGASARWAGSEDVVVGVAAAGRDDPALAGVVGCFVNTVPLRVPVPAATGGAELARQVQRLLLDDLDHQLPFEQLLRAVDAQRDPATNPVVQALFVGVDGAAAPLVLPGVQVEELPTDPGSAKLDLSLGVETVGAMAAELTYSSDLYDAAAADRLARQYRSLLAALVAHPDTPVGRLPLLDAAEGRQLAGRASVSRPADGTVLDRFTSWVSAAPGAPAVADGTLQLSYAELHRRACGIAGALRELGAGPERAVGLLVERSAEAVVGLLGIQLAGAAYVPIEPSEPAPRIEAMLGAAAATLVVTRRALAPLAGGRHAVCVDGELPADGPAVAPAITPASLAYVIFTSGSTGVPKGVAVEHRQLRAYVDAILERLAVGERARFGLVSTLAADLGHTSLYAALCSGGCVEVVPRESALDPAAFAAAHARRPVDVLKIVPSHLASLLSGPDPAAVLPRRRLVLGGEALGGALVDRVRSLRPELPILNHYGPTEATVGAVTHELDDGPGPGAVPLGVPLPHAAARVLDRWLQPVPPDVVGELFLGGHGVARGYVGDPASTAGRFVPDPFALDAGARLYRTGDLVRRDADGRLHFVGRVDDQVKLRGYRVEPGEVAAAARALPGVRDAVAVVRPDASGEPRLILYVAAPAAGAARAERVRRELAQRLPAHLAPSAVVALDALPLTANGKVDRRALPEPPAPRAAGRPPTSPTELAVAAIWRDLLGVATVGLDDDFFALGGHSLLATRVAARVRADLGIELPLRLLFESPTLGRLASAVDTLAWATAARPVSDDDDYEEGTL